jgi:signal transduction histidine kinase
VVHQTGSLAGTWDADRMAQVFSNLVGNALQHGTDNTVRIDLDGSDPACVTLVVANAGTIPPELVAHLFDPFRGGNRQPGRGAGLGLGLYIVQQIAEAHGGEVVVQSGGDGRTEFRVRVPRQA